MNSGEFTQRLLPYRTFPDWLGSGVADQLFSFSLAHQELFQPRQIGRRQAARLDPAVRNSVGTRELGPYAAMLRSAALRSLDKLGPEFPLRANAVKQIELELVAHNDGAFYKVHSDVIPERPGDERGVRRITMVYYFHRLPQAFDGGSLRLHSIDRRTAFLDIEATRDLMVAFPAFSPHSVEPVVCPSGAFADSRFAVNLWLRG